MTATFDPASAPTDALPRPTIPPIPDQRPDSAGFVERRTEDGVTIVVFSGDFDRVQAAFNIAVGAASSGWPVTMFFTFWGLDVITRSDARRIGRDPLRTAFRWLKPGGAKRLPLSRFNFLGLGPVLMRRLMGDFKMPTVDEMLELARSLDVKVVACTITMGVMGLTEADLIPEVDSFAGVATYLNDARSRSVNLFI
ncbi:MAG TPA: DsrE/DsrF/DrsH-like family protein [Candidatus Dormibacteraeota bacterium]|nr:DsrE/DsrF/DrsH-like family protein [Candidatus Dormibacteraeota bacterium]